MDEGHATLRAELEDAKARAKAEAAAQAERQAGREVELERTAAHPAEGLLFIA